MRHDLTLSDAWRSPRSRLSSQESNDILSGKQKLAAFDLEEVIDQAIDVAGLSEDALLRGRRGHLNIPLLVTLLACRDRTPSPAAAIAGQFYIQPGTIADLTHRARDLTRTDDAAAACQRELEKRPVKIIHQSTT